MSLTKYKIGDKVRVVKYGHLMHMSKREYEVIFPDGFPDNIFMEDQVSVVVDWRPEVIGKEGVVQIVSDGPNGIQYSLDGIPEKSAWYNHNQLELVKKNEEG